MRVACCANLLLTTMTIVADARDKPVSAYLYSLYTLPRLLPHMTQSSKPKTASGIGWAVDQMNAPWENILPG